MVRLIVVGLVVANVLLAGRAAIRPAPEETGFKETPAGDSSSLPTVRLNREAVPLEREGDSGRQCFSLGPMTTMTGIEQVKSDLESAVLTVAVREAEVVSREDYWVYLPPFETIEAARKAARKLGGAGVKDYYVFDDGPKANTISLGVYDRYMNANTRKEELDVLELGFEIMVGLQQTTEPRYWLDYEQSPGMDIARPDEFEYPHDLQRLATPCRDDRPGSERQFVIGAP